MKKPFSLINIIFLLVIFFFWLFLKIFIITIFYNPNSVSGILSRVLLTFLSDTSFLIYIFIVIKSSSSDIRSELKIYFKKSDFILGVLAGLSILGIAILLIFYLDINIVLVNSAKIGLIINDTDTETAILFGLYMICYVPFIEEILFRGYIWRIFKQQKVNEVVILFITTLLFAAAHLEIKRFVLLFINGIIIGFLRMRTNRLGPSIAAHITTNVIAYISYFLN